MDYFMNETGDYSMQEGIDSVDCYVALKNCLTALEFHRMAKLVYHGMSETLFNTLVNFSERQAVRQQRHDVLGWMEISGLIISIPQIGKESLS